MRNLLDKKKLN